MERPAPTTGQSGRNAAAHQLFGATRAPGSNRYRIPPVDRAPRSSDRGGQRTRDADSVSVLREHPSDVDAAIGLAGALLRQGNSAEALTILVGVEPAAGDNADISVRSGASTDAAVTIAARSRYFAQARAMAPDDPDVADGYKAVRAMASGHSLLFEGFGQHDSPDVHTSSGTLTTSIRGSRRACISTAVFDCNGAARRPTRWVAADCSGVSRVRRSWLFRRLPVLATPYWPRVMWRPNSSRIAVCMNLAAGCGGSPSPGWTCWRCRQCSRGIHHARGLTALHVLAPPFRGRLCVHPAGIREHE